MTFAWYGHLKYRNVALWKSLRQLGIAFFEYCFQVPANRIARTNSTPRSSSHSGSDYLSVFSVFSITYLGEPMKWNYLSVCLHYPGGVFHLPQVVEFRLGCITTSHPGESKLSDRSHKSARMEITMQRKASAVCKAI